MLEDAANINHIVVFLLPDSKLPRPPDFFPRSQSIYTDFVLAVLPLDSGAAIHYQWPGKPFQLLGG
jgi:hypothetical protein